MVSQRVMMNRESPSQGDLTKRWQIIKESARAKRRIDRNNNDLTPGVADDKTEEIYKSQNSSIDINEMYP